MKLRLGGGYAHSRCRGRCLQSLLQLPEEERWGNIPVAEDGRPRVEIEPGYSEEVDQGMSPQAVAVVYGGLVGGVLAMVGVVAGILLERYLQGRGKLRCVLSRWELAEVEPLQRALCSFEVYLFNERILATGLHDVSVAFHLDGEQEVVYPLKHSATAKTLSVLDLPPRRWVHVRPYALLEGPEARELSAFRRADFVGRLPDGREFRRTIVGRGDFVASHKRPVNARKDYDALPWWRRISER